MMTCTRCGVEKPTVDFISTSRARESTGRGTCKACFNAKYNRSEKHVRIGRAPTGLRKCRTCQARKDVVAFDFMPDRPGKLRRSCRECYAGNLPGSKACPRCGVEKPLLAFGPRADRPGPRSKCRECVAYLARAYAAKHPQEVAARDKAYRAAHLEAHRAYMREYCNARYSDDPSFRLAKRLRSLAYAAVTRAGGKKAGSVTRALGCTPGELRAHLEKQWAAGMSWETHGDRGWHIEHIKPLAWFDLTDREQFLAACHYTNLQPMWWDKNLEKRKTDGVLGKKPKPAALEPPCPGPANWQVVQKADRRCRVLADMHYTRQTIGAAMFTRPGYNQVLYRPRAVFVWWRPKWEAGIPGTRRKDGLECIECTLFRNEQSGVLSSELILAAEQMLLTWERARDAPIPDGLVTAVGVPHTAGRRGKNSRPGECYLRAGWEPFAHPTSKRKDLVWLRKALPF